MNDILWLRFLLKVNHWNGIITNLKIHLIWERIGYILIVFDMLELLVNLLNMYLFTNHWFTPQSGGVISLHFISRSEFHVLARKQVLLEWSGEHHEMITCWDGNIIPKQFLGLEFKKNPWKMLNKQADD